MKRNIIVFDFDKTLTYQDTLLGFYRIAAKKNIIYPFKLIIYLVLMVLHKLQLINNNQFKNAGVFIFLRNQTEEQIVNAAQKYKSLVRLNKLYEEYDFQTADKDIIIITGSFDVYARHFFPSHVKVFGTQLDYQYNKVKGVKSNCFGNAKKEILLTNGINNIHRFYTDSFTDYSLATISSEIIIVQGDNYYSCKNIEEFSRFFKK